MSFATPALSTPAAIPAVSSHGLGGAGSLGLTLLTSRLRDFLGDMLVFGDVFGFRVRHGGRDILRNFGRPGLYVRLLLLLSVWDFGSDVASLVSRDDDWLGVALGRVAGTLVWNSSMDCHMLCLGDMDSV